MPFSHHSHSGQFCGHATDSLQEVVETAISKKMSTFCMTEHISRQLVDFYPNEEKVHTPETLAKLYDDFYHTARALQKKHAHEIQLFVGFEGEWIREYSLQWVQDLLKKYPVDLFVGSVHHVHTIAIDYDKSFYQKARDVAGGSDERLFEDYFDSQFDMLQALKPPVVGHFDLVRLMSDEPNRSLREWSGVWERAMRNLRFIAEYGGVLELNTSALRKGLAEAYPQVEICKEFRNMGGCFTLSDDSHGCGHVATNYGPVRDCIARAGITELSYLASASQSVRSSDPRFPHVGWKMTGVEELGKHAFWNSI